MVDYVRLLPSKFMRIEQESMYLREKNCFNTKRAECLFQNEGTKKNFQHVYLKGPFKGVNGMIEKALYFETV